MRWAIVLGLVACGGTTGDPGDAQTPIDASADVVAVAPDAGAVDSGPDVDEATCRIDGIDYVCSPGTTWTWGDAATECFGQPCPLGEPCSLIYGDSGVGVCE